MSDDEFDDAALQAEIERLKGAVGDLDGDEYGNDSDDDSVYEKHLRENKHSSRQPQMSSPNNRKVDFASKVEFASLDNDSGACELRMELKEKDAEIANLRAMLAPKSGTVESIKDQKYLEALKKVKMLTVKLEKEKNINNKLTKQMVGMERQLLDLQNLNILPSAGGPVSELASVMPGSEEDMQRQFKEAKAKVEKANKVIEQMRRQNQDLSLDLKRAKQVLAKELGDENVDKAFDEGSGWRGRAQTITLLQSKVKELQRKRAASTAADGEDVDGDGMSDMRSTYTGVSGHFSAATGTNRRDHEAVHQSNLEKVQSSRAKELEDLKLMLNARDKEIKELKDKANALTARCANQDRNCQDLKLKLHRVIEKTENDDKLIELYKEQLEKLKRSGGVSPPPARLRTPPAPTSIDTEAEEMIQCLRAELQSTKQKLMDALYNQMSSAAQRPAEDGLEDSAVVMRLRFAQVEADKLRDLVQLLKGQLNEEIEKHATTSGHLRAERQKSAGFERTLAKDKGTINVQPKPGVEDKLPMLRDENRSLKEQVLLMQKMHKTEMESYKGIIDRMKATLNDGSLSGRKGLAGRPGSAGGGDTERELVELKKQYSQLRSAYNSLAMQQK
uniref:Uncharacterized protein n=1 Tax=Eutreptiella gymnastica TaxID=73025 RepID=A0A7S1IG45_9EUGL|mmetsp:Transcript_153174/g.267637  ORF Transcript_153174/g.267637 Transcript_153174/m.267637 type:complete len:617 (+) Transcript_153174:130-1980(+)